MKKIEVYESEPKGVGDKVIYIADYIKKQNETKIKENPVDQRSMDGGQANPVDGDTKTD